MNKPEIHPDGTYIYRDENGNVSLALKDQPILDEDTNEIIGYETLSADYIKTE